MKVFETLLHPLVPSYTIQNHPSFFPIVLNGPVIIIIATLALFFGRCGVYGDGGSIWYDKNVVRNEDTLVMYSITIHVTVGVGLKSPKKSLKINFIVLSVTKSFSLCLSFSLSRLRLYFTLSLSAHWSNPWRRKACIYTGSSFMWLVVIKKIQTTTLFFCSINFTVYSQTPLPAFLQHVFEAGRSELSFETKKIA